MSAPVVRAYARKRTSKVANRGPYARKVGENAIEISLCEFTSVPTLGRGFVE